MNRSLHTLVLLIALTLPACRTAGSQTPGSAPPQGPSGTDEAGTEALAPPSPQDETAQPSSGYPNTGYPNTGSPNTGSPNTGPPDSSPPLAPALRFPPDAAPAGVLRTRGSLPLRAWRPHVRIYSDLPLDFERLANIAQWTRDRSFRWLGDPEIETGPIEIFLADHESELRRLEEELPLPGARPLARTSKGGYFHSHLTILLVVEPDRNTEWLISHEMFHSVFRTLAKVNPPVLNEGLAEVIPSWILFGNGPTPENTGATYPAYEQVLAELAAGDLIPPLDEFLRLTRDEFHRNRWANFSMSWSLARLLIESQDPELKGRVPELIHALYADPFEAFAAVYDADHVERLWRTELGLAPAAESDR